jgi:23S rRNA (pseudouridine1915-N3)-methyltransferase
MRIRLITVSNKQPGWVVDAYDHYARRLDRRCPLELVEIPLARRSAGVDVARAVDDESSRMLRHAPAGAHLVALAVDGAAWSTEQLSGRLESWLMAGVPVCLLVGGPDGLGPECLTRAAERWSLSRLTLPHGLVRVVVAEALYRAASLSQGHPYHRA